MSMTDDLNLVSDWLALSHTPVESGVLVLVGSSLASTCQVAARAFEIGTYQSLLVTGGIGHSTKDLWRNASIAYPEMSPEGRPEAEIFAEILVRLGVPDNKIIVEPDSTNCGANAHFSRQTLEAHGIVPTALTIMQDPTMSRRTWHSFRRAWEDQPATNIRALVPFRPVFSADAVTGAPDIWPYQRGVELVLGEVPRLRDDANGYGPLGRNYIEHVTIPAEIEAAHARLLAHFPNSGRT